MVLVTGGTGLLGSHLLYRLSQDQSTIRAIFRDSTKIDHVRSLFKYYSPDDYQPLFDKIEWVEGDILDVCSLTEAMKGVDYIYHCAGFVSFVKKHFHQLIKVNREGTANVVNCALDAGVKKLCYVSSTAAIGGEPGDFVNEETKWKTSTGKNGYSTSKYSAEKEVWRGVEEGLDCVIVNPSVIFGAGFWDESSLTIFRTIDKGIRFYTSGSNGFVDARDVVEIMVRLTQSDIKNKRYLCVGHNMSFKDLMSDIAIHLGKNPPSINTPQWLMGLTWRFSWVLSKFRGKVAMVTRATARTAFCLMKYDNSKIRKELSYEFRTFEDTIQNTIKGRLDKNQL